MAQVVINIPDDKVNNILDAFADQFGWNAELGITKASFAKNKIINYIKDVYRGQLHRTASQQNEQTINSVVIS